eukprot:2011888-Amphidinium_carterae.4
MEELILQCFATPWQVFPLFEFMLSHWDKPLLEWLRSVWFGIHACYGAEDSTAVLLAHGGRSARRGHERASLRHVRKPSSVSVQ